MKSNLIILCACLPSLFLGAADKKKAPGADPDLPQPVDMTVAQLMLDSSPFTRSLNLSDSLVLTGIAYIQGKAVATILDKGKGTSYVVSDTPNAQGWKLAEATRSASINRAQAKIYIGGEIVVVRYGQDQTSPEDAKKHHSRPDGGGPPPDGGPPRREYHRPSEDDKARYMALSDTSREKLQSFFRDNREKMMNATPEERMQFIKSNFERIEKEDKGGGK